MLFPTIEFAIFFALVFPISWGLNRLNTVKKIFLVSCSYLFYGFWSTEYLLLLFCSSVGNYTLALIYGPLKQSALRRLLFWIGVAANLCVLGYFKYYNFFIASVMDAIASLGFQCDIALIEVSLPIAISFLTFHALSYLIDIYKRELPPSHSLVDILLYISFFPHLIAGPIVRAAAFLQQTEHRSRVIDVRLGYSVLLILGGLFKKVIVANYISTDFVDGVFRTPADYSSLDVLLGAYAYAIQIYCDFSAYTDIAIGVANLLGYEFPQNFNQPYSACTLQDFWRRWHITLSNWLRDYLYIPLGGNRYGGFITIRNIIITMGLGGLWHGASLNFVIWGLLHGFGLSVERVLGVTRPSHAPGRPFAVRLVGWALTFHFVCFAWVFFRCPNLDAAGIYLQSLYSGTNWTTTTMTPLVMVLMVCGAFTQMIPPRWVKSLQYSYEFAPLALKIAIPAGVIFLISVASPEGVPPFIYFQF